MYLEPAKREQDTWYLLFCLWACAAEAEQTQMTQALLCAGQYSGPSLANQRDSGLEIQNKFISTFWGIGSGILI